MKNKAMIVDLDGTIANLDHRLHYIQRERGKKDYESFYLSCLDDSPIEQTITVIKSLQKILGLDILITTGRSDICKNYTEKWLAKYDIPYSCLLMRENGNSTPDDQLKSHMYKTHIKERYDIFCVFDDRPKVVTMRRNKGLFVFDVNHRGEF